MGYFIALGFIFLFIIGGAMMGFLFIIDMIMELCKKNIRVLKITSNICAMLSVFLMAYVLIQVCYLIGVGITEVFS